VQSIDHCNYNHMCTVSSIVITILLCKDIPALPGTTTRQRSSSSSSLSEFAEKALIVFSAVAMKLLTLTLTMISRKTRAARESERYNVNGDTNRPLITVHPTWTMGLNALSQCVFSVANGLAPNNEIKPVRDNHNRDA
jgi:hypothetical protein